MRSKLITGLSATTLISMLMGSWMIFNRVSTPTPSSKNFTLNDLQGNAVSLSDF